MGYVDSGIVTRDWREALEWLESCGYTVSADYWTEPEKWLYLADDDGNEYECEVMLYSSGEYELNTRNIHMTGLKINARRDFIAGYSAGWHCVEMKLAIRYPQSVDDFIYDDYWDIYFWGQDSGEDIDATFEINRYADGTWFSSVRGAFGPEIASNDYGIVLLSDKDAIDWAISVYENGFQVDQDRKREVFPCSLGDFHYIEYFDTYGYGGIYGDELNGHFDLSPRADGSWFADVNWDDGASVTNVQLGDDCATAQDAIDWCVKTYQSPVRGANRIANDVV